MPCRPLASSHLPGQRLRSASRCKRLQHVLCFFSLKLCLFGLFFGLDISIYLERKLLGLKGVTGSFSVTSLQVLDDNDQIDDKDVDNNENEDDEIDHKVVDVHDSGDDGLEDDFVDLQSWLFTYSQSKSKPCSGRRAGGPSRTSCHR